jgi:hypothetical protein
MSKPKFLTPEELPEELRGCYDFDSQAVEEIYGIRHLCITRTCAECGQQNRVQVAVLRRTLNKLTGLCFSCHSKRTGEDKASWRGGRYKTEGYIRSLAQDHPKSNKRGYIYEHRLVMEAKLGRYLTPSETVHHKNGIRDDNRIENLELRVGNHGAGQQWEDLSKEELLGMREYIDNLLTRL